MHFGPKTFWTPKTFSLILAVSNRGGFTKNLFELLREFKKNLTPLNFKPKAPHYVQGSIFFYVPVT